MARHVGVCLVRIRAATPIRRHKAGLGADAVCENGLQRLGLQGMKPLSTVYAPSRVKWRQWLSTHYQSANEIWLIYYKKASGKPRIAYNDAVEEALCFGWIDSTVRRLDDERYMQRFSPRNPKSPYSPANRERLRRLVKARKVRKDVLARLGDLGVEDLRIAVDILDAIKSNKRAWKHFRGFSESYKRIRIGFIEGARRRPAEFQKRLRYFLKMTELNRQIGFGGIEKYY
jgi:uncharacterized protein YdeI (YjbR/CyaY-like superfamily)